MKDMINCKPGIKVSSGEYLGMTFSFTTHIYYTFTTCENFKISEIRYRSYCVNSITLCSFCYTLVKFQEKVTVMK